MQANYTKSGRFLGAALVVALGCALASIALGQAGSSGAPGRSGAFRGGGQGGSGRGAPPPLSMGPFPGGTWKPGETTYGSAVDSQLSVTMSDGVGLKADVSYPTDKATGARARGPFPVILTLTPYAARATQGDLFVQRGYIFVTAWVRGMQGSGGDFGFFNDRDAQDGAELVKWAATQLQNSNGTVGLWGGSYGGLDQVYTVAKLGANSPVKAMAAYCMGSEFYRETYFNAGIPTQTTNFQRGLGGPGRGASAASGAAAAPTGKGYNGAAYITEVTAGGPRAYYNEFWKERSPGEYAQKIVDANVPVLIWSSNGDLYAQSSLELFTYLQNGASKLPIYGPMKKGQVASPKYQIIISQGGHCANQDQQVTLEWYDTWLKGVKTGMQDTKMPIHVHELVSNQWLNTSAYPVVPTYTRYYLNTNGGLTPAVPSAAGKDKIAWAQPGDGSTLQYESPAFQNGGTLAGPISASFYASSTTKNLELITTLQVVKSDGSVTPLSQGAVMGSLSANDPARSWFDTKRVPVRPYGKYVADEYVPAGSVKKYDFLISPRFAAIPAGGKLRLIITTQTLTSRCGGGLGVDPCFPTDPQKAALDGSTTTLYYGPANSSSLNLPLLKANCWKPNDFPNVPYWKVDPKVAADGPCQVN